MEYSNPELPEGINTSKENPLKEFFILTTGLLAFVFLSILLLIIFVDNFADKIPFEMEKNLPVTSFLDNMKTQEMPPYLKKVSQKVLASIDLPKGMKITFHYVNDDTVNAFATLAGHVVLYRGLLEKLKYEDELTMVIAHEVAHVKYRHPILSASHGLVVGIALTAISNSTGSGIINDLVGTTGTAALMKFSRNFEYQADKEAINSLIKIYGHADGAIALFEVFKTVAADNISFEFLATHPLTANRISQTTKMIQQNSLSHKNKMLLFPKKFQTWLKSQKDKE